MIFETNDTSYYPGMQFQFDHSGTRRTLMRTAATGTTGTELQFWTVEDGGGITQRLTIDDSGNVGIGTTNPTVRLHLASNVPEIKFTDTDGGDNYSHYVNGSSHVLSYNNSDSRYDIIVNGTGGVGIGVINPNTSGLVVNTGNVGIGTTAPSANLTVSGLEGASGTINIWADDGDDAADKIALSMSAADVFSIQPSADSTTGIQILDTDGGTPILNIDTTNEYVGIGTTAPSSILEVAGAIETALSTKTTDYTVTASDSVVIGNPSSADITFTLPTAVGIAGRQYTFKNINVTYNTIIDGSGTETIDGALTKTLDTRAAIVIISDGANWMVKSQLGTIT
jgi:hypothetical protein